MKSYQSGCLLLGALLYGCQTPSGVYELAETSSATAGSFQQNLSEMAAQSKSLAGRRADHIVEMDAFNAELETYLKREMYMREKSNNPADWQRISALVQELTALRDELISIESAANIAERERRKSILDQRKDLNAYGAAMRDAANALNALAQRESDSDRAKFIGKFLVDVQKEVRTSLDKTDKTSQAAKAVVEKVKADLKSAGPADSQ